jgi:acyl carrier protein
MPLTLREFKQLIIETLQLEGISPEQIADDQPLFGGGLGLDSVDALELLVACERRFGVKIRAHELERDAFGSAAAMFRAVEQRLGAATDVAE